MIIPSNGHIVGYDYLVHGPLHYCAQLPKVAREVREGIIAGTLERESVDITPRWKEPPHRGLANLPRIPRPGFEIVDPKAIQAFSKRYGVLGGVVIDEHFRKERATRGRPPIPEPEEAALEFPEPRFYVNAEEFTSAQELLRRAWRGESDAVKKVEEEAVRGTRYMKGLEIRSSVKAGGINFLAESLWSFMCVLFLRDYGMRRVKVCASPECPAPFFLQERKGQKYCSHKCAVLINVRRFRKRQRQRVRTRITRSEANLTHQPDAAEKHTRS